MEKGQVLFRVDASQNIGSGHIMRCLTLADALRENGVTCRFICRPHLGNLILFVKQRGYEVLTLPDATMSPVIDAQVGIYAGWLGSVWDEDAAQTQALIATSGMPEWLIIDHYAIDERWERAIRQNCGHILVIDDLANRRHDADILLDQTLGRKSDEYKELVSSNCELRCGIEHVLLRPEFEHWRPQSLSRRTSPCLKRILVSLGGVDKDNLSREVLLALEQCGLPPEMEICIVLGEGAPWIAEMRDLVNCLHSKIEMKVAVNNMAELMSWCDLAIGAAGTATWERCCLGVPTIMLVLADNQREIANRLSITGAVKLLKPDHRFKSELAREIQYFCTALDRLLLMSKQAAALVPCSGASRLARYMAEVTL